MSKPKLYLHAGTHKTGTTSIQAFAVKHRKAFLRKGLFYPKAAPLIYLLKGLHAHHWFAHALAGKNKLHFSPETLEKYTNKWAAQAQAHEADAFLSVEALYRHKLGKGSYAAKRKNYLQALARELQSFDVSVILVYRRPDDYLRSFYQGRVMNTTQVLPDFSRFVKRDHKGLYYHQSAVLFKKVFKDVRALVYEDLVSSGAFFTSFFAQVGVDVSDLDGVGAWKKALSVPETMVKNFANNYLEGRKASKAFLRWMRTPKVAGYIRSVYGDTLYDLWPSHAARHEFLVGREDDLEKLRREFFPDRETLFPPLNEGETLPPVPPLPKELKQMVFEYFGRKTE